MFHFNVTAGFKCILYTNKVVVGSLNMFYKAPLKPNNHGLKGFTERFNQDHSTDDCKQKHKHKQEERSKIYKNIT